MSYNADAFHRHVEVGNLEEIYGYTEVVIICPTCQVSWERPRRAHRADTIWARDTAVQHLRQHGIFDAPALTTAT
jgi:hypothetical protein